MGQSPQDRSPAFFSPQEITLGSGRIDGGGFSDLYTGIHEEHGRVALKRLRLGSDRSQWQRQWKRFVLEVGIWQGLRHEHVLPFLGLWIHEDHLHLVSPFAENGSLRDFLTTNPSVDRVALLRDVADGLTYLHNQGCVHGDIKALNVLISVKGRAMLCDFGLSKAMDGTNSSGGADGSVRWQSPERLQNGIRSVEDDVYAYGITIYETLSGHMPYPDLGNSQVPAAVLLKLSRPPKEPPASANGTSYATIWIIAERCWAASPTQRPSLKDVLIWLSRTVGATDTDANMLGSIITPRVVSSNLRMLTREPMRATNRDERKVGDIAGSMPSLPDYASGQAERTVHLRKLRSSRTFNTKKKAPRTRHRGLTPGQDDYANMKDKFKRIETLPRAKSASYDSQRSSELSSCLKGTRIEVLGKIERWVHNTSAEAECIFFLNGMAGTGKTTIAYTAARIADKLGLLGATYFFSAHGDEDLRCIDKVISSIAYQLARFDVDYKSHLTQALDDDPDLASKTRQMQMQGLIIRPLQHVIRTGPIVIVFDALDECGERGSTEILQLILAAIAKVTVPLRILVTSRPEPHILSIFRRYHHYRGSILHDIEESVVHSDIKLLLSTELAHTNFDPPLSPNWMTQGQLDHIVRESGKLFIYAVTAVRFIRDNRVHPPHEQLQLLLMRSRPSETSGAFADLDRLYLQLLETAVLTRSPQLSFEQIRETIGALVLVLDPLSMDRLERLLSVPCGYIRAALYPLQSIFLTPESDDGIPRAFHQSFSDFITDPHRCSDTRFTINIHEHQKRLTIRSLKTMLDGLHYNMANISDPLLSNAEIPDLVSRIEPEMSYACRFWVTHLCMVAPHDPHVVPLLESFASRCLMWWIEVCSVLNSLATAVNAASAARTWAQHSCSLDTINIFNDAYRFLLANGNLINAYPLHIYASALPFAPQSTALCRIYSAHDLPTIKVLCGQEESWSASLAVWSGHENAVCSVEFSPDGSRVVSGSTDKTIRIWDAISGEDVATLEGHRNKVFSVKFSPDGAYIASGSADATVRIWDAVSGDLVVVLEGQKGAVVTLAFSPDGSRLASGSYDGAILIWETALGAVVATLSGHKNWVRSMTFSSNGSRLVSISDDQAIHIHDSISGKLVSSLADHARAAVSITLSHDGSRVASGFLDGTVRIWDSTSGEVMAILKGPDSAIFSVAFSPDASRVVSGSYDKTVRIWDAISGDLIVEMEGHSREVMSLAFSPDGARVVSGSGDRTVRIWDAIATDVVTRSKGHQEAVSALAFSPDGSQLLSASSDSAIRIWDLSRGQIPTTLGCHGGRVCSVAFSSDGSQIVSVFEDRTIQIWDAISKNAVVRFAGLNKKAPSIAFVSRRGALNDKIYEPDTFGDAADIDIGRQQVEQKNASPPRVTIQRQWLVWEHGSYFPIWLCKLPSSFSSEDIPVAVHQSKIALGNTDGVVTILDVALALDGHDIGI